MYLEPGLCLCKLSDVAEFVVSKNYLCNLNQLWDGDLKQLIWMTSLLDEFLDLLKYFLYIFIYLNSC